MSKTEESFLLEPERYEFRAMPMHQFALGRPPLLTMRWPSATGLTS